MSIGSPVRCWVRSLRARNRRERAMNLYDEYREEVWDAAHDAVLDQYLLTPTMWPDEGTRNALTDERVKAIDTYIARLADLAGAPAPEVDMTWYTDLLTTVLDAETYVLDAIARIAPDPDRIDPALALRISAKLGIAF